MVIYDFLLILVTTMSLNKGMCIIELAQRYMDMYTYTNLENEGRKCFCCVDLWSAPNGGVQCHFLELEQPAPVSFQTPS